jgi:putative nucleotidyltransferase with HDIG domain
MRQTRVIYAYSLALYFASLTLGVVLWHLGEWDTPTFAALLALAIGSDFMDLRSKDVQLSGSFLSIILAAAILGPGPAALIGVLSTLVDALRRHKRLLGAIADLGIYAAFPMAGGIVMQVLAWRFDLRPADSAYGVIVIVGYFVSNVLNFLLVARVVASLSSSSGMVGRLRTQYLPVLPSELAMSLLAAALVYAYAHVGVVALGMLSALAFAYEWLLRSLLVSQERGEELEQRTTQLASLQMGVLSAMLQTLSLRDRMTARHSAAVARYAREIAREHGCSEAEQELVHTAGLLHDIGKFIFPDRILVADSKLSDEDWEIVKRHPAQGAKVVRAIEGYGPVADIILCHHERMDGLGYPRAIDGEDIPLLSRMISIADTYDVMTARDSYREPVSPADAITELRRVSGTQLDGHLVELFITVLKRKSVAFRHADDADFEAELSFDKRVREYAQPQASTR